MSKPMQGPTVQVFLELFDYLELFSPDFLGVLHPPCSGTLTNQITQKYLEPRLLIVTD